MDSRFAYVMDVFRRIYRVPEIAIGYGQPAPGGLMIVASPHADVFDRSEDVPDDALVWATWAGKRIPFLFGAPGGEWVRKEADQTVLAVDVIASAFYFLSNWQEWVRPAQDGKGRFRYDASIQKQLGITHIPVVNYYFDLLREAIALASGQEVPLRTWGHAPFAFFGSHDIDTCETGWLQGGYRAFRKGRLDIAAMLLLRKVFAQDVWFNFSDIIALEQGKGAVSSFYFIARHGRVNGLANADYDIRKAKYRKVFQQIEAAGSEVGLHGSLGSHADIALLQDDLARLNHPVKGNRFHFLGYNAAQTPALLAQAGFEYDTTLGFAEHIGFRNGICHPFFLYDHARKAASTVLEIPLMAMDATLQFPSYQGLSPAQSIPAIAELQEEVKRWGGVMGLLWHNTHFSAHKYGGWRAVYAAALADARAHEAAFMTGAQVSAEWRSRG